MEMMKNFQLKLKTKDINLTDIEEKFSIEKFNGRQNAKEWIKKFQSECERYSICDNQKRIDLLKLFQDGSSRES